MLVIRMIMSWLVMQESVAVARVTRDSSACMKAPMVEI